MKKQKGMIITAAVLLAAAAVVTGSRLIRHPEKSNTKKSEVKQNTWFLKYPDLCECDYLGDFIQCSDTAGKRKKHIRQFQHLLLSLTHIFRGIGTLDEISEVITLTKIGVFQKPCILFNRNSFYEPLKTMFTQMEQAGFWWKESMRHVLFSDDLEEISAFIEKWDDVK